MTPYIEETAWAERAAGTRTERDAERMGANDHYTNSALRVGDEDHYPQRRVGEFIGNVVSNTAVNDEDKHVVLRVHEHALKAYAGQMFHLLCPSPDGAEVWMRRPMSVYRVDRTAGDRIPLQDRGTRHPRHGAAGAGRRLQRHRPARRRLQARPGLEKSRGARPRRGPGDAGAAVATGERKRGRRHRDPERAPCGRRHVARVVRQPRRPHHHGARFRQHQRGRERRDADRGSDRPGQGRRLLHLRLEPAAEADAKARQEARHPGPGRHGADHGLRLRRLLRLHANLRGRRATGAAAGLPRRAGVQHAGGGGMVDLSVKIGDITLQNPVTPASGAFSWEYNDVIALSPVGALVAKTICREPRLGNPTPRMAETEAGIIQSIGLPGKGIEYFLDHIVPEYARFKPPLIVSCSSDNIEDFAALAEELSVPDVDVIEANI